MFSLKIHACGESHGIQMFLCHLHLVCDILPLSDNYIRSSAVRLIYKKWELLVVLGSYWVFEDLVRMGSGIFLILLSIRYDFDLSNCWSPDLRFRSSEGNSSEVGRQFNQLAPNVFVTKSLFSFHYSICPYYELQISCFYLSNGEC